MKKYFLIFSAILFFIILLFAGFVILQKPTRRVSVNTSRFLKIDPGIEVTIPGYNAVVTSPLKIKGKIHGFGWVGFEGQVGTVTLVDQSGKTLAQTFLPATTDWMKLPTTFEATLTFEAPTGKLGKLIFRNENASGEASRNKTFELPILFP